MSKERKRKKRKGVVAYFFLFVFLSIILIFLFAFAIPMLIDINVQFYAAGEMVLDDTDSWIDQITDADVKAQIESTLDSSKQSIPDQIDILGFFFQYGWIIIILTVLFVVFMATRTTVETEVGIR